MKGVVIVIVNKINVVTFLEFGSDERRVIHTFNDLEQKEPSGQPLASHRLVSYAIPKLEKALSAVTALVVIYTV